MVRSLLSETNLEEAQQHPPTGVGFRGLGLGLRDFGLQGVGSFIKLCFLCLFLTILCSASLRQ